MSVGRDAGLSPTPLPPPQATSPSSNRRRQNLHAETGDNGRPARYLRNNRSLVSTALAINTLFTWRGESLKLFPTLPARKRHFEEFVTVAALRQEEAIFSVPWEEKYPAYLQNTDDMCQISISQRFGGSPRWYQSVASKRSAELRVSPAGYCTFFFVYSEIKSMGRGPMNTKTQSPIHRKAHALQKCCHLVPEEVVFILQRSSSPSASLALALIER